MSMPQVYLRMKQNLLERTVPLNMQMLRHLICSQSTILTGILIASSSAWGVPLDREIHKVNLDIAEFMDFTIFEDAQDRNFYYVAPNYGGLVRNQTMPALSYADAVHLNQKFAVLNAVFQFGVNPARFQALKDEVRRQNPTAKFAPLPMSQTTPSLVIAGSGDSSCFESEDFVTGEKVKQCINLTHKVHMAQKGPTLGEQLAVSMVLSPIGAEIVPKLLAGGSGVQVNLEYQYRAALPAVKATVHADYKKVYESYAWYAAYHNGVCTDIALSDFWEKTVACDSNNIDSFGRGCSVHVTYKDSQGREMNNLFDIVPAENDDAATKEWYRQYSGRMQSLWSSIDGLRKDFEAKFLTPVNGRRAEVDKTPTTGFALRADRSRTEDMGTYHFERDLLGSIGTKRSVVPAYTTCVAVNGATGAVGLSSIGRCSDYYQGVISAAQLVPVVPEFSAPSNGRSGPMIGPVDWES